MPEYWPLPELAALPAWRALNLLPAPRPVVGFIAGGEWYVHQAGGDFAQLAHDPAGQAACFVQAHGRLGMDLLWSGAGYLNHPAHALGCPLKEEGSITPAITGPALASLAELENLDAAGALASQLMADLVQGNHLVAQELGLRTVVMATTWGPFTLAARLLGAEQLMMATIQAPAAVERLLDFSTDFLLDLGGRFLEHPLMAGLNYSEPAASCDLISPAMFSRLVMPRLARLIADVKGRNRLVSLHICGNSAPLLPHVAELAPHGFSLEHKVDLAQAKATLGGKVCVLGNLSPTELLHRGTPEAVRERGLTCQRTWGPEPGYILAPGCDIPRDTPLANLAAMMSLTEENPS